MFALSSELLRDKFVDWATRKQSVAQREITLRRDRIYILPTRYGYLFGLILFVMLMGSMNYNNSMAFLLTFLLSGLGINAMWQTHRNLLHLKIFSGQAKPVFAGDEAVFNLIIENMSSRARPALIIRWREHTFTLSECPAHDYVQTTLVVPTTKRGFLHPRRFLISTRYPLGLFEAWSWLEFDMRVLVYPKPIDDVLALSHAGGNQVGINLNHEGREDFQGLRSYHKGDSPKHIAWKAFARTFDPLTKQFTANTQQEAWLEWDALSGLDPELRLSILCHWVLLMDKRNALFGLKIPGRIIGPAKGDFHRYQCLESLTLYGEA